MTPPNSEGKIVSRHQPECPFCDISRVQFPDKPVYDIEPLNPVTKGHRLVIPREHVSDFTENPHVSAQTMLYASELAKEIGDCNIITSKGESATQSVRHLHIHIVPRRKDDELKLPWTGQIKKAPLTPDGEGGIKEMLTEFDKLQRLFLAGKFHSTKFNDWFRSAISKARAEARESLLSTIRERVNDLVERFRCGACDNCGVKNLGHTQTCVSLTDLLTFISALNEKK